MDQMDSELHYDILAKIDGEIECIDTTDTMQNAEYLVRGYTKTLGVNCFIIWMIWVMGHYKNKDIDIQNWEPKKMYEVIVLETLSRIVKVEAMDEEDAVVIVQKRYDDEEIVLWGDDCASCEIEIVKE